MHINHVQTGDKIACIINKGLVDEARISGMLTVTDDSIMVSGAGSVIATRNPKDGLDGYEIADDVTITSIVRQETPAPGTLAYFQMIGDEGTYSGIILAEGGTHEWHFSSAEGQHYRVSATHILNYRTLEEVRADERHEREEELVNLLTELPSQHGEIIWNVVLRDGAEMSVAVLVWDVDNPDDANGEWVAVSRSGGVRRFRTSEIVRWDS